MADASVDLIFADPPYNIGKNFNGRRDKWPSDEAYLEWSYKWLEVSLRKLKPNGSLYFMCSTQCLPYFDLYLRKKLTVLSRIIWFYDSSASRPSGISVRFTSRFCLCSRRGELHIQRRRHQGRGTDGGAAKAD